jgi:hypothetical protein
MSRSLKLAVIPGDGIGPEVIAEALKVLDVVAPSTDLSIEKTHFSLGAERYLATGDVLSDEDLAAISANDAILLGAVGGKPGDARIPAGIIERGLLLKLRFSLDHYVNLRPTVIFPGVTSPLAHPGNVDFIVVREGTEGPYVGNGGVLRKGTPAEIANELSVNTAYGVERVVRYAFELAAKRDRKKLTLVHKTNVLVNAGALWSRIVDAVATEYPQSITCTLMPPPSSSLPTPRVSTSSSPTTCSVTSSLILLPPSAAVSASRQVETSTPPTRSRACLNPSTVRHLTSQASRRQTPRQQSCRLPFCWNTSATPQPRSASTMLSLQTWPSVALRCVEPVKWATLSLPA